eukprot:CAMPEP_0170599674 /NCGR_PEP_ID=MMETSP0224-20130122/16928_1 /TAXON_ID=285029 /ORGANISM="Togula jolla, Strain CCCM 725" /LENGTH=569 /DNA_ID=CAMNT_0010924351 /DNA_START=68 /DNA_END=1777 /DNA_ORIENTATION=+
MTASRAANMTAQELDRALHSSVLKREEWKEREFREQREKHEAEIQLGFGSSQMCKQELRKIIDSDRRMYYRTEELNDKLYIHYKGWRKLQGLDTWTGLKALYAECNAFDRIEGLQHCRNLRSLFLQENCIKTISGLETCTELWTLNLSSNFIERIDGLSHLHRLNTLIVAKNKIGHRGVEDIEELLECPSLATVDIQDNCIWDPDVLPEVFARMDGLRVLYLKGNPCAKKLPNYRKSITAHCWDLRYLDDRPVFEEDRRAAEAFNRSGLEGERAERRLIKEENSAKHEKNMRAFADMVENAKREHRERKAMRCEDRYTEEEDPGLHKEREMKAKVDKWKEENAEDLKDDAKEYAKRCLQSEKANAASNSDASAGEAPAPADSDTRTPSASSTAAEPVRPRDEPKEEDCVGAKEDKRKLVYDDIWDDEPPPVARLAQSQADASRLHSGAPQAARPVDVSTGGDASGPSSGSMASGGPSGIGSTPGVFLPWASGANTVGMEAVQPSAAVLEQRGASLSGTVEAQASGRETSAAQPAWYGRYVEQLKASEEKPSPAEATAAATSETELGEMD